MNRAALMRWAHKTLAFGDGARAEFLESLAGLVDAGIPVYDAIREIARAFRRAGDGRAAILVDIARGLDQGKGLADAMRPWLAPHECMILDGAAKGVALSTALRHAAELTESRRRIIGAVTGALGYPAVLLALGVVLLAIFSFKVIPTVGKIIAPEHWHGLGAVYYAICSAVNAYGLWMLAALVAAGWATALSLSRWRPNRIRRWLDRHVPPWNLHQVYQAAIILISISIMMRSGIPMADAVKILWSNNASAWLRQHLAAIRRRLEEGGGVRLAALDHPVFPTDIRVAVALFDRLSDPDAAMARLGKQATLSAERSARRIGALCNAAVLFLVGGLVGGIIPSIMSVAMEFHSQVAAGGR